MWQGNHVRAMTRGLRQQMTAYFTTAKKEGWKKCVVQQ